MKRLLLISSAVLLLVVFYFVYEGLTGNNDPFKLALPGYVFQFPRDHFSHPDYKIEWWYYTGHLQSSDKRRFGFQLTFFRYALSQEEKRQSQWASNTVYFAHFALTDIDRKKFFYHERVARGSLGESGASTDYYRVWIDDWVAQGLGNYFYLEASHDSTTLRLILRDRKKPAIHGINGVSQKAEALGRATHYYSLTRLHAEGLLILDGRPLEVSGEAWMDKEFGSNQLDSNQTGWDWFSVQLDNNEEIMLYQIRLNDGSLEPASSGTWIKTDGSTEHLQREDFQIEVLETWKSKKSGAAYPLKWRIKIPRKKFEATILSDVADQELVTEESTRVTYWEGSVTIEATLNGIKTNGVGYTELTGYAGKLKM